MSTFGGLLQTYSYCRVFCFEENVAFSTPMEKRLGHCDMGRFFILGLVSCCGEGNGTPLQYSCLENPMDGGAWKAAVHGVAEGWIPLSDFTFTFHFHALEKEMATHSSVLA